ncbi:MAG: M48 family metallopeptidase [Candidatus Omnitrophota bacterium]
MNSYLAVILIILVGEYLLDLLVESLNVRSASSVLPEEFCGYYDAEKYQKSQDYLKENTVFSLIKGTIWTMITLVFILFGGFNFADNLARGFGFGYMLTGLIFAAVITLAAQLLNIPFSAYHTFVIEEKYGFNKTTIKTYVLDFIKSLILTVIIGGIIFSFVLWFFTQSGQAAWIYCWGAVTLLQLFLLFIAPVTILPLFNKFIPLEKGALKEAIERYAREQGFKFKGIFKMDASRRSSKANAFFIGFGRFRRIVLFDTLIEKLDVPELVSVFAHEIGHYKKRHILKNMLFSTAFTGLMFFILSLFMENPGLFAAFRMEKLSVYAGLFFFGFLYSPINVICSVWTHLLSRRYEYAADTFAVCSYREPEAFIRALKKLTVSNLSNLTPHPVKVFIDYSHPPILQRIKAIRKVAQRGQVAA